MSLDWLKEPLSDDAPCGPDLAESDDEAFVDYYYEAESRMPERYFVPGIKAENDEFTPGVLFDPRSIKHAKEKETIVGLLKRSRDLRLLSLLARFMVLAGRLEDFVEAVTGIADVLETFPDDVHPLDRSDQRSALDELGNTGVVGIPLQYVNLAGSAEVTYRKYLAATGQSDPREGEVGLNPATLTSAIGSPGNRAAVEKSHALLGACADALTRIKGACLRSANPFTPNLTGTFEAIADLQNLIKLGRSDLLPWSADAKANDSGAGAEPADGNEADPGAGADATGQAALPSASSAQVAATTVPNRAAAVQTLRAIELYFAINEPASAALLLVTQSRLLIGKPLIEAIETLLPENAARTKIDFGADTGFVMNMERLRMLSAEAAKLAPPMADEAPGEMPTIENRVDVAASLRGVEDFFRAREPASPIPLLLFRARNYLDRDFTAIVNDLIPAAPKAAT
jgi:type VI secretion system protein ImpA